MKEELLLQFGHGVVESGWTGWQLRGKMAALWKRLEARARGFVLRNRGFSSASIAGNSVIVERENGQMALETVWLRDHCTIG